jgi:hypothetical protein
MPTLRPRTVQPPVAWRPCARGELWTGEPLKDSVMDNGALTPQVSTQHEVQDEEAVFIVLECIPQIDDERVIDLQRKDGRHHGRRRAVNIAVYLLQKPALLDDIGDSLLLDAFGLVDVLESVEFFRSFVLDDSDL